MTAASCPSVSDLEDYALGRLADEAAERLDDHLALCAGCVRRLDAVGGDDLVDAVRRGGAAPPPRNAQLDQLRQRLYALAPAGGPAAPRPAGPDDVLVALEPPLGPDELGRLGPYRLLEELGRGGMGVVFRAEDTRDGQAVALKLLRRKAAQDPVARDRFLREAHTLASLSHDNIVPIREVGEQGGAPYLAMPLLHGETLEQRLQRETQLPLAEVLRIGREAALGLEAAHARGVIHRDVKPDNLWLEAAGGRVKILDFGLARPVDTDVQLTAAGAMLGTPAYMAPEQIDGKAEPRSDLFSLGCVLYRMATGRAAFTGNSPLEVLRNTLTRRPPPVRDLNREVPEALDALILQLTARDPDHRPPSARSVLDALDAFAAPQRPLAETAAPRPRRRRWDWLLLVAAGLALAAAAGVAAFLWRRGA
jgi:serine/threonine protein kinase